MDEPLMYDCYVEQEKFQETKLDDAFLSKLYLYYINKGYNNIIIKQITNLLNTIFLVLFILFLFNCVDYHKIININTPSHLSDFVHWDNYFKNMKFFSVVCFIMLIGFVIVKIITLINSSKTYGNIKIFYNATLSITDEELLIIDLSY